LISSVKAGNSIAYALFLVAMFIEGIFGGSSIIVLFWSDDLVWWEVLIRDVL